MSENPPQQNVPQGDGQGTPSNVPPSAPSAPAAPNAQQASESVPSAPQYQAPQYPQSQPSAPQYPQGQPSAPQQYPQGQPSAPQQYPQGQPSAPQGYPQFQPHQGQFQTGQQNPQNHQGQQGHQGPDFGKQLGQAASFIGNPLPTLGAAFASYVTGLIVAAIVIGLPLLGSMVLDTPSIIPDVKNGFGAAGVGQLKPDTPEFLYILGAPFQVVSMAFLGSYTVNTTIKGSFAGEDDATMSTFASLGLVPFLVLAAVLAGAFFAGRYVAKRKPNEGTVAIWVQAVIASFAVAVVSTLLSWGLAARGSEEIDNYGMNYETHVSLHAAGVLPFLGIFVLLALALVAGRYSTRPLPKKWPLVSEYFDAAKLALLYAATAAIVGLFSSVVVVLIAAINEGHFGDTLKMLVMCVLTLPATLLTVLFTHFGLATFSPVNYTYGHGAYAGLLISQEGDMVSVFTLPHWWMILPAIPFALLLMFVFAGVWAKSRRRVEGNTLATVTSWAALPAVFFVLSVLGIIFATINSNFGANGARDVLESAGLLNYEGDVHAGVSLATPFIAAVVGILVEVISRFIAPFYTGFVPAIAGGFVHKQYGKNSEYNATEVQHKKIDFNALAANMQNQQGQQNPQGQQAAPQGFGQQTQPQYGGQQPQFGQQGQQAQAQPQYGGQQAPQYGGQQPQYGQQSPQAPQYGGQPQQQASEAPHFTQEQAYGHNQPPQPGSAPSANDGPAQQ
ncbi:hypothetical protein [Dermabacter sp. Marseille-Q3180]|uniref:hypothetical protein n=1 Tax=Dermabacter sp. Marseille-Q3180 TaxID=2758090 RepID=UPI00202433AC|nr:hypothetical protein [Dermabacter sp. Marseille-Q3180]